MTRILGIFIFATLPYLLVLVTHNFAALEGQYFVTNLLCYANEVTGCTSWVLRVLGYDFFDAKNIGTVLGTCTLPIITMVIAGVAMGLIQRQGIGFIHYLYACYFGCLFGPGITLYAHRAEGARAFITIFPLQFAGIVLGCAIASGIYLAFNETSRKLTKQKKQTLEELRIKNGIDREEWMQMDDAIKTYSVKTGTTPTEAIPFARGFDPTVNPDGHNKAKKLWWSIAGHILIIAGSRSGKGRSQIINWLLSYAGPVTVLDLKGENLAIAKRCRNKVMKRKVAVFSENENTWGINVLDFIKEHNNDGSVNLKAVENVMSAVGFIDMEQGVTSGPNAVFKNACLNLVAVAIMIAKVHPLYEGKRNLVGMREVLTDDDLLLKMQTEYQTKFGHHFDGNILDKCKAVLKFANAEDTMAGVQLEAMTMTAFCTTSLKKRWLSAIDVPPERQINLDEYVAGTVDVFMCFSASEVLDCPQTPRSILACLYKSIVGYGGRLPHTMLMILDEAPRLGGMKLLEEIRDFSAGLGVSIAYIAQGLSQIKGAFKDGTHMDWFASCMLRIFFGLRGDVEFAKQMSETIGDGTFVANSTSNSMGDSRSTGSASNNKNLNLTDSQQGQKRALISPTAVMQMPKNAMLVFDDNSKPLYCGMNYYDQDDEVAGLWDKNPYLKRTKAEIEEEEEGATITQAKASFFDRILDGIENFTGYSLRS